MKSSGSEDQIRSNGQPDVPLSYPVVTGGPVYSSGELTVNMVTYSTTETAEERELSNDYILISSIYQTDLRVHRTF